MQCLKEASKQEGKDWYFSFIPLWWWSGIRHSRIHHKHIYLSVFFRITWATWEYTILIRTTSPFLFSYLFWTKALRKWTNHIHSLLLLILLILYIKRVQAFNSSVPLVSHIFLLKDHISHESWLIFPNVTSPSPNIVIINTYRTNKPFFLKFYFLAFLCYITIYFLSGHQFMDNCELCPSEQFDWLIHCHALSTV